MKKHCTPLNAADFKPKTLVLAVKKALPYLVALSLGAAVVSPAVGRSGDSAAAFTATQLIRQFTLKNTVAQVSQGMQGSVQEVNGVLRAVGMGGAPSGYPVDMGSVPSSANLPQRDGAGRPLGYCAWDNSSSASNASFLAGLGIPSPLVYAVVSPGLNGSMETSCAHILSTRTGLGDDYVQVTAPSQTSSRQFRSAVGTYADLAGMPAEEGDIRLVLENNRLYSYVGGAWQPVDGSRFSDDSASNGVGAIAYTTGKVTVADFQAASATISGALAGSTATFSSSVTANSFVGNGAGLTDLNASNISSGVLGAAFGGTGVDGSAAAAGSLLIGTGAGYALGSITAGDGIGILNGAGSITISNTGVLSIAGTSNQITASAANGDVVLSLPQDIATTSTPTFGGLVLNGGLNGTSATFSGAVAASRMDVGTSAGVANINTIIGVNAMPGVQSGSGGNTVVGNNALSANTTGYSNVAVGSSVLQNNTTGFDNTAVGYSSLRFNTTGSNNSAFGRDALRSNTTGSNNLAFGPYSMFSNTTGSDNVAVGPSTLGANTTGFWNIAVGTFALNSNTTGAQNTAIGLAALGATTTGSANTAVGPFALNANTTGNFNSAFGVNTLRSNTTGISNSAFGVDTMRNNTTGSGNAAFGNAAMRFNTTGTHNTVVGADALYSNSTGSFNVAMGTYAMFSNTTGNENVAIGRSVLGANTTGFANTAVGMEALNSNTTGERNVAMGHYSLRANTTGLRNVVIGQSALRGNTTGSYNVALGDDAGYANSVANTANANTTGSNNTFLGSYALPSVATPLNFATAIGSGALVGTSNTLVLGRTTDTTVIGSTGKATSGILQNKILQVTGDVGVTGALTIGGTFTATGFAGNGSGLTDLNADNIATGILAVARGGTGVDGSAAANGTLLIGNGSGYTLANIQGVADQINVTNGSGSITLGLPQSIATTSAPTFSGMVLNGSLAAQDANIVGNLSTGRLIFTNSVSNVLIGQNSLNNPESGYYNIAIGDYVMPGNISGFKNIGIGNGAQNCNETGFGNIALGYETLNCLISGDLNTAVGTSALYSTDGLGNTGIGGRAMSSNYTGNENTALGFYAGSQRGNDYAARQRYGSNNTYLGSYAHPTLDNLSYATAIGSDASVSTSNTLVLGRTTDTTVIGSTGKATSGILQNKILQVTGDVGVTGALTIGGTFTATGFAGNGSGLTDLNADNIATGILAVARGGTGVDGSAAANGALLIGNGSGYTLNTLTAGAGVSVTNGAGSITITNTGVTQFNGRTGNVTFAQSDLLGVIESSDGLNMSIGTFAASMTAGGDDNVAIGRYAQAQRGALGVNNTSVGASALRNLVSGSANSAFGAYSLNNATGSRNSALGNSALRNLISGDDNTAIGTDAAVSQTSGSRNVVLGRSSGVNLTTGNSNTFLGTNSGLADTTQQNFATAIGADALVSSSNTVVLGRTTDTTVIGSTSDDGSGNRLQVTGNAGFSGNVDLGSISVLGVPAQLAFRYASDTGSAFYSEPNLGLGQGALSSRKSAGNVAIGDGVLGQMNTLGYGDESGSWNTGVGYQALFSNDYGDENTAIGYQSLYSNTSGYYNTAVGSQAMYSNTTGVRNVAVGYASLLSNTTGYSNTAVGNLSMRSNTEGFDNTAVGRSSLRDNTTGVRNTAVGASALSFNTTGGHNVAVGPSSMQFNTTGTFNTAVGGSSMQLNTTGSYNSAFGIDALYSNTTGNNNTAVGSYALYYNTTGSGNVAIGDGALTSSTTASGNTVVGQGAGSAMVTSQLVTVMGQYAASNATGSESVAIGSNALSNFQGSYNVAVGNTALNNLTTGGSNTALGHYAMPSLSGGSSNIAIGHRSGNTLTSGDRNIFIGDLVANGASTGSNNIAIGNFATVANGLSNATVLGDSASVTTSNTVVLGRTSDNVVIGATGDNGTANKLQVTGGLGATGNVFLNTGNAANYTQLRDLRVMSSVDDLAWDHLRIRPGARSTRIDAGGAEDGLEFRVGQGSSGGVGDQTYNTVLTLKPDQSAVFAGRVDMQSLYVSSAQVSSSQLLRFGENQEGTDTLGLYRVNSAADQSLLRVGIGDNNNTFGSATTDELQVGRLEADGSFTPVFRVAGNGDVIATGYVQATAFNTSSDRRLKTNIQVQDSVSVLSRLEQLQTYSYQYMANPELGRRIGVIAQEIQTLFPEAVATRADGMMSVDYSALGAMAAMGVGQLSTQVKALDKTVQAQGKQITALDERITEHDTRITSLEGWKTDAVKRMDGMQSAIDLNIQKIAENAVAIQTNKAAIERLDDALFSLDGRVKNNTDLINMMNERWANNFTASEDGKSITVHAAELKASNFSAQQVRANSLYAQRLEAEMARIAELEVNNLRANSAVANTVQAEQVNTGSTQVYAGVGLPAVLFAAKSDGHYTVSTSALDGSYATATVIVNAGQAKVVSVSSEGIELYAEGNQVKVIAAGKSIKASWIKMG
ncbi:tail fiber domain-containing protein [Limnobacter alexandrii]|uniref:tail fiber domain-containing protein n=1 Tax=Limnobacter alexandrii TaxID=2570352 RepID=UPI001109FBB8|nr:tail fiber domain-containing protein [Limnobacter alexandrii]